MFKHCFSVALLALLIVFLTGCSLSTEDVQDTVKKSMQETFDTDKSFSAYGLKISEVYLVKSEESKYKGYAQVDYNDDAHKISISAIVDGSYVLWEAEEGSFLFLVEEDIQQALEQF